MSPHAIIALVFRGVYHGIVADFHHLERGVVSGERTSWSVMPTSTSRPSARSLRSFWAETPPSAFWSCFVNLTWGETGEWHAGDYIMTSHI